MIIQRELNEVRIVAISTDRATATRSSFIEHDPPDTSHQKYKMTTAYLDGVSVVFHYREEHICSGYRFIWETEWKYISVDMNACQIFEGERLTVV